MRSFFDSSPPYRALGRRSSSACFAAVVLGVVLLPTGAPGQATDEAAPNENPFATPEERRGNASPNDNPFATSEELANGPVLLMNQEPFDVVVLRERPPREVEVMPLDLPNRQVPATPDPKSLLLMRLRSVPEEQYVAMWGDVVEVRLFERLVLAQAVALTNNGRFDDAFDVFVFLRRRYPTLIGLGDAEQNAVVTEARHAIAAGRWENALALALRLNELKARHPQLAEVLPPAVAGLANDRLQRGELVAARRALDELGSLLPNHPTTEALRNRLAEAVKRQIQIAGDKLAAGRAAEAQDLLTSALALAPDSQDAKALLGEAIAARPRVVVGVAQPYDPAALAVGRTTAAGDDWALRRTAALTAPPPLDLAATTEGATLEYRDGWIRWSRDDETLELTTPPGAAYQTASVLLAAADPQSPGFRAAWAERRARITVVDDRRVRIALHRPYPRPEALVAGVLSDAPAETFGDAAVGRFRPQPGDPAVETRFESATAAGSPGQIVEIVERRFADEDAAVAALRNGEVDVVDRIAPWHVAELRSLRQIQLVRYAPLSVHCLCVTSDHPQLAQAEFRRALVYALDREAILTNHLRATDAADGSRPAAGVFNRGRTPEDPLGYADDRSIAPRAYDPQAALILSLLAARDSKGVLLTLGFPPTAVAAQACEQIRRQWSRIGVDVELRRLAAHQPNLAGVDLVYTVVWAPEPAVDADRVFGPRGLAPQAEREALAGLRQLADAETSAQARAALFELQRTMHEQTFVLPLWQLNEYAARRTRLNVGEVPPLSLYQFVDRWRISAEANSPVP